MILTTICKYFSKPIYVRLLRVLPLTTNQVVFKWLSWGQENNTNRTLNVWTLVHKRFDCNLIDP